jgi:hypothetical protein
MEIAKSLPKGWNPQMIEHCFTMIPSSFQRGYTWGKSHRDDLLKDLGLSSAKYVHRSSDDGHFLGTIVVQLAKNNEGIVCRNLTDGNNVWLPCIFCYVTFTTHSR